MCLGSNFAIQGMTPDFHLELIHLFYIMLTLRDLCADMKLIIAAIYTNYVTEIVDDEGIEQADTYISRPIGDMLILRFKHA